MANEFIIKNGFRSQGNSEVTGSVSINSTSSPQVTLKNPGGGSEGISSIAGGTLASFSPSTYDYIFGPITANPATVTLQFSGNDVFYGNITSGYIPQKNTIGFGNSPIYIDGLNNVGIGTSSPSAKFQVKGSGTSASTLTFLSTNNNNTPSLFIQDDGNVGINRNPFSPLDIAWWDLHVSGTVASNNYVIGDSMYVNTNVNPVLFPPGYPMLFKFTGSEAGYANVDFQIQGNPVLSPFGLSVGWSPLFTVKYDGKVGIGINNTQPTALLHVSGTGRFEDNVEITGSFVNILSPTSLKIQSDLSSSFGVGSTYINGLGWTPLVISGSTTSFRTDGDRFKLNGITQGNLEIPAIGASFPLEANIQLFATGSDYISMGTQFTDLSGIGGNSTLNANQNGVFSGSYGNNSYTISIGKTYGSDESSLEIQKRNNAGETIALNLNSGNDGFSIFSTLSQPTSSFLRIISGSTNLIDFRYDYNQIKQATIIGGGNDSNGTRLTVLGYGTTLATRGINVTNGNGVSLFSVSDNGAVTHGAMAYAAGAFSHATGLVTSAIGSFSYVQGAYGLANGESSHAEGYQTTANGDYSHAEGNSTITSDIYQHTQGQFNLAVSGAGAFIVGNGIDDSNRSNLIFASGSEVQITGSLLVTGSASVSSLTASNATISGNVTVLGTASINTLIVNQIGYSSGSNQLGDSVTDTQTLYGTVVIPTGSLTVTGSTIISSSAATQLRIGTNTLFVSSSGAVGIGTSTPDSAFKLDVNGQIRGSNITYTNVLSTNGGEIRINQAQFMVRSAATFQWSQTSDSNGTKDLGLRRNNTGSLEIYNGVTADGTLANRRDLLVRNVSSSLLYVTGSSTDTLLKIDSSASSSILFVSGSGRVGIGTNAPLVALDVRGTSIFTNPSGSNYDENIRLPQSIAGYAGIALGGAIAAVGTSATQWTLLKYPAASSNTFAIRNNVTDYLSITTAGNVGLGSNFITPTARLQVRGSGATSATTTFLLQNSSPINLMTVLDNGQFTFSSPLISLATSQSAFTISQSISASNTVGGQYYGVNITPTFFATTASQTETALRVAATFTGSAAAIGGQNIIADFGATSAGSQFTVTDVTSGSIYMVNDVSGLPIIEATSDWTVNMYNYPNLIFQKTGSQVNINGTLRVSGSFILPLSQSATPQTGSAYWSGSFLFVYDGTRYRSSSFA